MSLVSELTETVGRRRGFTLIELLVSMAVIGALVSILLPAIMQAREAANRSQCQNNLKQLVTAIHNYSESHGTLPIGARAQRGLGPSWYVAILPQIDQANLFNRLDMDSTNGFNILLPTSKNNPLLNNLAIPTFLCPSSSLKPTTLGTSTPPIASYVGISGATSDNFFPATRVNLCCQSDTNAGQISADGMLITNAVTKFADATDGLSNVMLLGESSRISYTSTNLTRRTDGAYSVGWCTGTQGLGTAPNFVNSTTGVNPPPVFNLTTLRYGPNCGFSNSGIAESRGANNPLNSSHVGGCMIAMCDGAVRPLDENVFIPVMKAAACRDDGGKVEW